jgi:hypothetical protein
VQRFQEVLQQAIGLLDRGRQVRQHLSETLMNGVHWAGLVGHGAHRRETGNIFVGRPVDAVDGIRLYIRA